MHEPESHSVPQRLLEETPEELYEEAPCGYVTTAIDDTILRVNRTFVQWTGHAREALVGGRRLPELLTPGGRIYYETHVRPLLQMQDTVLEIALEVVRADGRRLPVLVNCSLKRDESGRPAAIRTTVFKATDRKKYERELLHMRRRERAARERTERLQRLTAALADVLEPAAIGELLLRELGRALEVEAAVLAGVDGDRRPVVVARRGGPGPDLPDVVDQVEPAFADPGEGSGTAALVPLWAGPRPVALLAARLAPGRTLTEDEQAFVVACAGQCAQALERARLRHAAEDAAARATFLADLGRVLDEAPRLRDRTERLVAHLTGGFAEAALVRVLPFEEPQEPVEARSGPVPAELEAALRRTSPPEEAPALPEGQVVLPLRVRERRLGTLAVVVAPEHRSLVGGGRAFLSDVADRAALAVENSRLFEHERTVAHQLQRSLIEMRRPADPRFGLAAHYQPGIRTLEVGGDWHDGFWLPDGRFAIVVGDVVGRGLHAASVMGQLRSAVRALAGTGMGPGRVLEQLDGFVEQVPAARMATAAYAEVDVDSGLMRYACAGHPPPVLASPGGEPGLLWGGRSAPLGAYPVPTPRPDAELTLARGDRILLYTDGLVERRSEILDDGLDRLLAVVRGCGSVPAEGLLAAVTGALLEATPDDDACLLCFELCRGA